MTSVPQSSWFCIQRPISNGFVSPQKLVNPRSCTLKASSSSSNAESSPPQSEKPTVEQKQRGVDPVKLAFEKAKAYKKTVQSNPTPNTAQNLVSVSESAELGNITRGSSSVDTKNVQSREIPFSVRVAMAAAKDYKKSRQESDEISAIENGEQSKTSDSNKGNKEVPAAVKLALEKAKEYKKSKGVMGGDESAAAEGSQTVAGFKGGNETNSGNESFGNVVIEKEELKISSIDFMGLGFADKKSKGLPPGLIPVSDSFPEGDLPEVEILVGDSSRFEDSTESKPKLTEKKEPDVYKPKVSTWGVFPRPSDISKTYGGGRVIRPGEVLETAEDKAAKQKRTKELLSAYKKRTGLIIDPKLKSECEKSLNEGDSLMDIGKLKEALPFYEKVMDSLPFQSELHGLAALQWSICQDSLSRREEARVMYEKLQSHPVVRVRKKASTLSFGFQAMEMLKLKNTNLSQMDTGYGNYFEAFVEDRVDYTFEGAADEDDTPNQALPFVLFLLSPIVVVLLLAIQKRL